MKHKTKEGQAHFHVILKRRFAYYIISVYLPSLSLLMVTHWTNFISVEHFEANIMVHLTAMLVMYTLFQATSISLPQVCYKTFFDTDTGSLSADRIRQAHRHMAPLRPDSAFPGLHSLLSGGDLQRAHNRQLQGQTHRADGGG